MSSSTINIADYADLDHMGDKAVDFAKPMVELPDIDESQFDDDVSPNVLVHIRDDGEEDFPSIKHGMPLMVAVYVGAVIFALGLVAGIFYWSRKQERQKSKADEDKKEEQTNSMRSSLTLKPWSTDDSLWMDKTAIMSDRDLFSERDASEASEEDDLEEATPDHRRSTHCCAAMDGPCEADAGICRLCDNEFELGQPVYESNNPQCEHQFHKACMDRWLNVQNTCPTCNQPYILQTV